MLQPSACPDSLRTRDHVEKNQPGDKKGGNYAIELFRNKRQGKLSSKKAMEGANQWVYSSETTVR